MVFSPYRFLLAVLFFLAFSLVLMGRLFYIQVAERQLYKALAQGQQKWFLEIEGNRGDILVQDISGDSYIIAATQNKDFCFLEKDKFVANENDFQSIALALAVSADELKSRIEDSAYSRVLLNPDCSPETIINLKTLGLNALEFEKTLVRVYPHEEFGADVIGFLGGEGSGQYGIEGFYDQLLKGESGLILGERNPWGFSLNRNSGDQDRGANIVLTIDYNVQREAEKILKETLKKLNAVGGQIIVVNPINGQVIALADYPTFEPNFYFKVKNSEVFKNGAIQELFEPGSVFKPIVMAAGLDSGKLTPETSYDDQGFVKIGSYTIYNYDNRTYGRQTMRQVLEKSINTGAVFAQKQTGIETFLRYVKDFGFFEKTNVDLQGETYSQNLTLRTLRDINLATASFGQGIAVTPMQIIRAFSAIANGGNLITPHVLKYAVGEGGFKKEFQISEPKRIISEQTAEVLTSMLVSVTEEGFGRSARVPGYYVAGKTGTAQVPWTSLGQNKAGYSEKTIQSFAGFFPAFDPKFLILVKLDHPEVKTAEYSAVPVFRELAGYLIEYYLIPPDYKIEK